MTLCFQVTLQIVWSLKMQLGVVLFVQHSSSEIKKGLETYFSLEFPIRFYIRATFSFGTY